MLIKQIGQISGGQDGAIWGSLLFRFDAKGVCRVHDLAGDPEQLIAEFALDKRQLLIPHSNAVMFGTERYAAADEFPLLYTNIYNNHAKTEDPLKGVCCVYRLQRQQDSFVTTLVQLIRIGFVEDRGCWCSPDANDVRPYGNFAIDRDKGICYAFTMLDGIQKTRYFSFRLPSVSEGAVNEKWGVKEVVLTREDIIDQFDCPYHRFVQGACTYGSRIYSLEGFTRSEKNPPALRIISLADRIQEACIPFGDHGLSEEPEFIDFFGDVCYYSDHCGNLYTIMF